MNKKKLQDATISFFLFKDLMNQSWRIKLRANSINILKQSYQQWKKLEIGYEIFESTEETIEENPDYFDKFYIIKQIKRYDHFKDAKEICDYVEKKFHYDGNGFFFFLIFLWWIS